MGTKNKALDFTCPVATRGGSDVKFYEIFYGRYINGAYYEPSEDIWYPCSWDFTGQYSDKRSALDLVNIPDRVEVKDID